MCVYVRVRVRLTSLKLVKFAYMYLQLYALICDFGETDTYTHALVERKKEMGTNGWIMNSNKVANY